MSAIKLISLNVERSKHLDLVLPFLERERADVVCLQEVSQHDVQAIAAIAGAHHSFVPMQRRSDSPGNPVHGIGIFSNLPFKESVLYYAGSPESIPESSQDAALQADPSNKALLCAEFAEPSPFFIITTHFTWSPRGEATDEQRADMRAMLPLLQQQKEFVFCGDFNAPRGGEIWQMLASNYRDNIPPEYKTSLDLELHRAGKTHPEQLATKMVDGLFTTPGFVASNVRLQFGISDHAAIVATIARA